MGYKLLFCLFGVIFYLSVASFCSSFYSTFSYTKTVNFCSFVTKFNQACTKYSAKCIQGDPHTRRVAQKDPLSVFLIHRQSPLLIKCTNHRKKNYHHKVNELGCPRPGLTTSNARPSFKPLYVLLTHCTCGNKVLEQL